MKIEWFVLFVMVLFCNSQKIVLASDSLLPKKIFINHTGHYGFIIAHRKTLANLIKSHIPAGEINLSVHTNGEKNWERFYHLPEKGIGIMYAYLGNPKQLGNAFGIFPFVNFPLNPGRKFKLYIRSSDGIGVVTNPYDRITNHKNSIIGSRLNAFINLRLNSVFFPAKKIKIETGIGLTHLSNGSWAKPNLGINIATINIGIGFMASEIKNFPVQEVKGEKVVAPQSFFTVITAAGPNESGKPNGEKYAGFSVYAAWWKNVSPKSRFCVGADLFYEFANLAEAEYDTLFNTNNPFNNFQFGIRSGYELVVGKIGLPLEMGLYLFNKHPFEGPIYHRIGIRYYVNKHLIFNYSLKTHWVTAELLEFGVGWRF